MSFLNKLPEFSPNKLSEWKPNKLNTRILGNPTSLD
jgi:hypothetical protein